jgi:hypothetical protein
MNIENKILKFANDYYICINKENGIKKFKCKSFYSVEECDKYCNNQNNIIDSVILPINHAVPKCMHKNIINKNLNKMFIKVDII